MNTAPPAAPRTVLLVEDDPLLAATLRATIEALEPATTVLLASSAPDALAMLAQVRPDLVITDMYLRGIGGGLDVARAATAEGVRTVCMSGQTRAIPQGVEFIPKEHVVRELARILRGDPL